MTIKTFETEEYFGKYEFTKPYMISASDCESTTIGELITLGGGTLEEFSQVRLGYPQMEGSTQLRREISSLYQSVQEGHVLVLGSPIEGIYISMRSILRDDDHVIVLTPAYDALLNVAESITRNVDRWYLRNDGSQWFLDFDALKKLITRKTKLLIVNFPHNPTGFIPTQKDFEQIFAIAETLGVKVFSDEMYRGLEYDSGHQLRSAADIDRSAIVLGGASKNLGLPGLRFGWLTTKDPELYKDLLNWKCYTSMCSPQPLDYLGRMAIRAYPALVRKNLEIIRGNLALAERFFERWGRHFTWLRPKGGSVSVLQIKNGSAESYCREMADTQGVVLLPTKFMGYEDRYARIGLGRANFNDCLNAWDRALAQVTTRP